MKLTLIESQGLIRIYETETKEKVVNARELHEGLRSRQEFSNWIKKRLNECDAVKNVDFSTFDKVIKREGSNLASKRVEYLLKLDIAKEMAMLERNEKGKAYRRYLIEVEKRYKAQQLLQTQNLSPQLQLLINMEMEQKKLQQQMEDTKQAVQNMRDVIIINPLDKWRKDTNVLIHKVANKNNIDYRTLKTTIYSALEARAKCNLKRRLDNLKMRALANGMRQTQVNNLNRLDVIGNDTKLKEIYIKIVGETAIKNNV